MNTLLAFTLTAIVASKTPALSAQTEADYVLGASTTAATHSFSLAERYPDTGVNAVFSFNILHTLDRMSPTYSFTLQSGQTFAFHDTVLPEYANTVAQTMNSHFNGDDGFVSDGWLIGDGVCHLASLMYWTAKDANLKTSAPTNHNFAVINGVPKEYGVSILSGDARQNLYITNSRDVPILFTFTRNGDTLTLTISD